MAQFSYYMHIGLCHGRAVSYMINLQILLVPVWHFFVLIKIRKWGKWFIGLTGHRLMYRRPWWNLIIDWTDFLAACYFFFLFKSRAMSCFLGDRYEVEIRGCSIWCTELITDETRKLVASDPDGKDLIVNSILIDHYLWDYRREHANEMGDLPFHRIRCIYYWCFIYMYIFLSSPLERRMVKGVFAPWDQTE